MRKISMLSLALALLAITLMTTQSYAQQSEAATLRKVIKQIEKEATASLAQFATWPSASADYAQKAPHEFKEKTLIDAFTRQLHKAEPIDAYIKWQLTSYIDTIDLGEVSAFKKKQILNRMPTLVPPAAPRSSSGSRSTVNGARGWFMTGTSQSYVANLTPVVSETGVAYDPQIGTLNLGTLLDVEVVGVTIKRTYLTRIRRAVQMHQDQKKLINLANEPMVNYRDAFLSKLKSDSKGYAFTMALADAKERVKAAHTSHESALTSLSKFISPQMLASQKDNELRSYMRELDALGKVKKDVLVSFSLDAEDKLTVDRDVVTADSKQLMAVAQPIFSEITRREQLRKNPAMARASSFDGREARNNEENPRGGGTAETGGGGTPETPPRRGCPYANNDSSE